MVAYCHDPRPPLFAKHDEDKQPRLSDPSPPPWQGVTRAPADFYKPIFQAGRYGAFNALLAGVLSIVPEEGEQ